MITAQTKLEDILKQLNTKRSQEFVKSCWTGETFADLSRLSQCNIISIINHQRKNESCKEKL